VWYLKLNVRAFLTESQPHSSLERHVTKGHLRTVPLACSSKLPLAAHSNYRHNTKCPVQITFLGANFPSTQRIILESNILARNVSAQMVIYVLLSTLAKW
jgi:hypothetical protein